MCLFNMISLFTNNCLHPIFHIITAVQSHDCLKSYHPFFFIKKIIHTNLQFFSLHQLFTFDWNGHLGQFYLPFLPFYNIHLCSVICLDVTASERLVGIEIKIEIFTKLKSTTTEFTWLYHWKKKMIKLIIISQTHTIII